MPRPPDVPTELCGFVGALVGAGIALLFHWLAPEGTDTVMAGAWFVGGGAALGLFWSLLDTQVKKNDSD